MMNLKVRGKLLAAFGLLIAVLTAISGMIIMDIQEMRRASSVGVQAASKLDLVNDVLTKVVEYQNSARGYALSLDKSFETSVARQNTSLADAISELVKATAGTSLAAEVARLQPAATRVRDEMQAMMADSANPETRAAALAESNTKGRLTTLRNILTGLKGEAEAGAQIAQAEADRAVDHMLLLIEAAGIVAVAMAALMAWLLARSLGRPIEQIAAVMSVLAKGARNVVIPALNRTDEIGDMARSVQVFQRAVEEKLRLENGEQSRREAEELRQRGESARAATAARQMAVIEKLGDALAALERADLTCRLHDLPPEFHQIERDYNAAMERLEDVLGGVVESSEAIHGNSGEVAQVSTAMAERAEQQAANLEEAAAALEEITATMKGMADGAQRATGIAGRARQEVEASQQILTESIAAIRRISDSSGRISSIIEVIDGIAFQTNLLALNAGVEAARAGNAGLGFAVVAAEVRALAQRSAAAAKEIKGLIETSQNEVRQGVQLIDRTGEAMQRIRANVGEVDQAVIEIAHGAREQSSGIQEVNTAVSHMEQATQQNAAIVEEASSVSQQLYDEVSRLAELVGVFQMSRDTRSKAASRLAA
jgi:methyl-accepting chemotaxis protein